MVEFSGVEVLVEIDRSGGLGLARVDLMAVTASA